MDRHDVRISKFLSFVLRHRPDEIGLQLDPNGWASVAELMEKARAAGVVLDEQTIRRIVAQNEQQRFALSDDGTRIRANQGHSVEVDLKLEPVEPPEVLYHGTATRFLQEIRREGLRKMSRQYVHLSPDEPTAIKVGRRYGKVVVLKVKAGAMWRAGHRFYRSANGVWLTDAVPPEYLLMPE